MALLGEGVITIATYVIEQLCEDLPRLRSTIYALERRRNVAALEPAGNFLVDLAGKAAVDLGHGYIGPEHIVLALSREPNALGDALRAAHLSWGAIREVLDSINWQSSPPH
jgi:hypothetical protein